MTAFSLLLSTCVVEQGDGGQQGCHVLFKIQTTVQKSGGKKLVFELPYSSKAIMTNQKSHVSSLTV